MIVDVDDVSVMRMCISAWSSSKYIWEIDVWVRQREDDVVMLFCVGDSPPGIPQCLYSMLHKHSQRSTGESTSQSVPGLKARLPLPHHNDDPHTNTDTQNGHGHACKLNICSKAYRRMLPHTQMHRVGFSLLHILNCPQWPPSIYSWQPQHWYHLILSQLHQPTPHPPISSLTIALVPSVSFFCLLTRI